MFDKQKEEFKNSPGKFIIVFFIIFLIGVGCIYQLRGYFTVVWPTNKDVATAKKGLVALQRELQVALNRREELTAHRESFVKSRKLFWIESRDGDPALNIQSKINSAAKLANISLSSVGAARSEKVSDGISLVSVSVRGESELENVIKFLAEIEKIEPRAFWKSLVLRPYNQRSPEKITCSGSIQFIIITDEEAVELLLGKK